jgi:hypothetical protein
LVEHSDELQQALVYALLLAHGFGLLSRIGAALGGRPIQFLLRPGDSGQGEVSRRHEYGSDITYTVDPRCLVRLAVDDAIVLDLCDRLKTSAFSGLLESEGVPKRG